MTHTLSLTEDEIQDLIRQLGPMASHVGCDRWTEILQTLLTDEEASRPVRNKA